MLKIGVTGGIGSGKSLVCDIISKMGYPVYNADSEARNLTNTHPIIVSEIKKLFGDRIYLKGNLNRKGLAKKVFSNARLLEKLNAIVHPVVAEHFSQWVLDNSKSKLVFKEAAILFESGAFKQVDLVVAVWAPVDIRIDRVCKRDGITKVDVLQRMYNQINEDELLGRADYVIKNDEKALLVPQINSLIEQLLLKL